MRMFWYSLQSFLMINKKKHEKGTQKKIAAILSHGNKFQNECNRKKTTSSPRRRVHHSMLFTEIAQSKKVIDDVFFPSNE